MSQPTSIEWTDVSWNPVHGCSKVSPGCAHCYAETLSRRYRQTPAPWTPANAAQNVILKPHKLNEPLKWREPRMVFVNSMSDLFHELVPDDFIADVFTTMACAPQHTFQVLTKRPERAKKLLGGAWIQNAVDDRLGPLLSVTMEWPLPNVWLGVSIENRRFTARADVLRATPAAVRFISAEPLLGPLISREPCPSQAACCDDVDSCICSYEAAITGDRHDGQIVGGEPWSLFLQGIDWLIVGGESGPGHRHLDLQWVRDLRDECPQHGTAFFVKQLGGARPGTKLEDLPEDLRIRDFPTVRP